MDVEDFIPVDQFCNAYIVHCRPVPNFQGMLVVQIPFDLGSEEANAFGVLFVLSSDSFPSKTSSTPTHRSARYIRP